MSQTKGVFHATGIPTGKWHGVLFNTIGFRIGCSPGLPRFQQPLEPTSIPPVGGGLYNCVSLMSEPLPKVYFWGLRMISYPPPPQTTLKSV